MASMILTLHPLSGRLLKSAGRLYKPLCLCLYVCVCMCVCLCLYVSDKVMADLLMDLLEVRNFRLQLTFIEPLSYYENWRKNNEQFTCRNTRVSAGIVGLIR